MTHVVHARRFVNLLMASKLISSAARHYAYNAADNARTHAVTHFARVAAVRNSD